ncbi:hypothetical protein H257_15481 [Aphanomyces astaci]|uniref:Uncharacterized protein n=1 Tax=Aphanomyces astaci TaxID=112090 RepID=W4FPD4_APHAT|nr:hypothetical protein H257_15481 [Aphanomyces astaci]ETV68679.1 hypothetical protein H257_15481 [Aphanomyces astaci]|eukprot:XP_009841904.1 hypothetical protein H257_15481 [Aphanomyces astaci]
MELAAISSDRTVSSTTPPDTTSSTGSPSTKQHFLNPLTIVVLGRSSHASAIQPTTVALDGGWSLKVKPILPHTALQRAVPRDVGRLADPRVSWWDSLQQDIDLFCVGHDVVPEQEDLLGGAVGTLPKSSFFLGNSISMMPVQPPPPLIYLPIKPARPPDEPAG